MADLELVDALTDTPPQVEPEIKRDFISSLEAEPYDDIIGEKCDKTDYVPLLDDDEANGSGDKHSAEGSHHSVLENGEHHTGEGDASDLLGSPGDEDVLAELLLPPQVQICPAFTAQLPDSSGAFDEGWLTDSYSKSEDTDAQSADTSEKTTATFGETPSDESTNLPFQVPQSDPISHIWQPTVEEQIALSFHNAPEHEELQLKSDESPFDAALCAESQLLPRLGSPYLEHDTGKSEFAAVPEEAKTGSDITAPPTKELPASPEKKVKASAAAAPSKTAATPKGKPLTAPSPKKPVSAAPTQPKKAIGSSPGTTNNTATPKRPLGSAAKTTTPKETEAKPKSPVKSPDKKTLTSATAPRPTVKASSVTSKLNTSASLNTTGTSAPKPNLASKRPTSLKNDVKAADAKKTTSTKPPTEPSRLKSAPADLTKSNGTTLTSPSRPKTSKPLLSKTLPGSSASADAKKPPATRPASGSKTTTAPASKPSSALAASKPAVAPKQPRPATAPDLKNVRSKIGSTDNMKHQPGGGKAKVEKKPVPISTARKPVPAPAATKTASTKPADPKETVQKQSNGKVQIVSKKVNYSHVQSKCGSKDNIKHVPGGGNVTNPTKPSIGSSRPPASTGHKPGSANVQILNKKVDVSKVASKCGSKPNVKAKTSGGDAKSEDSLEKETTKQEPGESIKENGGEITQPQIGDLATPIDNTAVDTRENGLEETLPVDGSNQREIQSFNSLIPETN